MKTTRRGVFWLFVSLFVAGGAAAESPVLDRIVGTGVLRVGLSGDQPPFNATDRSGALIGLEVDLANLLAAAFDVELRIVKKDFPELLGALDAKQVDIVLSGMAITAERSRDYTFVGPYVLSGKSILTKSANVAEAREAGDLDSMDLTLVVLGNSTSQTFVEKSIPKAEIVATQNYEQAIRLVLDDEVDAMVADMPICMISVLRYPGKDLVTSSEPLSVEPIGIAVPSNDPQLVNLLQNYLAAFEGTGIMEELRKKWMEDGSWIAALP